MHEHEETVDGVELTAQSAEGHGQAAGGMYPVYLGRDDEVGGVPPWTYVDDPLVAAHWDEIRWRNGALPGARLYSNVPQG